MTNTEARIVTRPINVVQTLPPEFRWEFTRRHPYYLMWWECASQPDRSERENSMRSAAQLTLMAVNITAKAFPSPNTPFGQLDPEIRDSVWEDGAVTPLVVRGLLAMLTATLPTETKRAFAQFLERSAALSQDDRAGVVSLLEDITRGQHPHFDDMLPSLVVTLNPNAPARAISGAIERIVGQYKAAHGITETRRRDDKLPDYLQVWDLREGWTGSGYDASDEKTLKEIAKQLKRSLKTVSNQYHKAFFYLCGHEYSPRLWCKTMGLLKRSFLLNGVKPRLTRRPLRDRGHRPVPVSVLVAGNDPDEESAESQFLERAGLSVDETELHELLLDLESMISRGATVEQLCESFGIPSEDAPSLDIIRERLTELRSA